MSGGWDATPFSYFYTKETRQQLRDFILSLYNEEVRPSLEQEIHESMVIVEYFYLKDLIKREKAKNCDLTLDQFLEDYNGFVLLQDPIRKMLREKLWEQF